MSPRVSPVKVSLNFATAPMSPACSSVTGTAVLPCMDRNMREFFGRAAGEVLQRSVVLQHAGKYLEEGDASGERIADGLEDIQRNRLGVADLARSPARHCSPSSRCPCTASLDCRRQVVDDEVQHLVGADVAQAGSERAQEKSCLREWRCAAPAMMCSSAMVPLSKNSSISASSPSATSSTRLLVRRLGLLRQLSGIGPTLPCRCRPSRRCRPASSPGRQRR